MLSERRGGRETVGGTQNRLSTLVRWLLEGMRRLCCFDVFDTPLTRKGDLWGGFLTT